MNQPTRLPAARHPDETGFWDRITADPSDATSRLVYADWLDDHDDPHAWVFREPVPFADGYLRWDWTGAAGHIGAATSGGNYSSGEVAGGGVPFTLTDGSPVPPFVAYLLGVIWQHADSDAVVAKYRMPLIDDTFFHGLPSPVPWSAQYTDSHTGVPNRLAFDRVRDEAFRRAAADPFTLSVLSIDVDDFRQVNNWYTYSTADYVLVGVARLMRDTVGVDGLLARTSGDGFHVILPAGLDRAVEIGERIRRAVEGRRWERHYGDIPDLAITVSIGVAASAPGEADSWRVVEAAAVALYRAKEEGRNQVCVGRA